MTTSNKTQSLNSREDTGAVRSPEAVIASAIETLMMIVDGSNWPADAQRGPKFHAYTEISEQLHDLISELQTHQAAQRDVDRTESPSHREPTTPTEPQAGADNYDDFPLAIHGRPLDGPAQPVSGDQEAIARIIDPAPFNDEADDETCGCDECKAERLELREAAFAKADAILALRAPAQGDGVQNMAEALSRAGERCGLASLNERTKTHYLKLAATALATLPPSMGVERTDLIALSIECREASTGSWSDNLAHVPRALLRAANTLKALAAPPMPVERGKEGATLDGLRRIIRLTATRKPEDFDAIYDEATKLHRSLNAPTPSASRVDHASVVEECAKVAETSVRQDCCGNYRHVITDYDEKTGEPIGGHQECCGEPTLTPMYPDEIAANIRSLAALQSQDQIHDSSSERVRSPVDRAVEGE